MIFDKVVEEYCVAICNKLEVRVEEERCKVESGAMTRRHDP